MKLKIQTRNGTQTLSLGLGTSPVAAAGQLPTGVPGVAALQILGGWGHGPTSGLGGADWTSGCGIFRGESYRMGPSFGQEAADADACAEAGISRLCSPSNPKGPWQFPWSTATLAPLDESVQTLTLPVPGRLYALELEVTREPLELDDPCPCDLDGSRLVSVSNWRSQQITTTYPGLGRETQTSIGGVTTPFDPNNQAVSARYYTAERLLNGQNFLPPWVPNVDLKNGNDQLSWGITNISAVYTVTVQMTLHIMYGSFDLRRAIDDYCEQRACEC